MIKVYVLFNEGEIEGIYKDKEDAEATKRMYLNMSVANYFHIEEHNYYEREGK